MAEKGLQQTSNDLVKTLDNAFKQAPRLPDNIREVLVKIAPWLSLIFGILGVIAGLGAVGLSPVAMLGGVRASSMVLINGLILIVSSVLMLMAYPKLNKRQYRGWELLFWSEVLSTVSSIVSIASGAGAVGAIIGVLIGFYLLFQIKGYYK